VKVDKTPPLSNIHQGGTCHDPPKKPEVNLRRKNKKIPLDDAGQKLGNISTDMQLSGK
jgi:hypothetical protein